VAERNSSVAASCVGRRVSSELDELSGAVTSEDRPSGATGM